MKRAVITLKSIRALGIRDKCPAYRLLREAFPDGVPLTVKSAEKLAWLGLSVDWYAIRSLNRQDAAVFRRARDAAVARFYKQITPHYAERMAAVSSPDSRIERLARKKYQQAIAPFRERQRFAEAKALLALLLKEHKRNGAKP